jgi:hypothetical protein
VAGARPASLTLAARRGVGRLPHCRDRHECTARHEARFGAHGKEVVDG